MSELDDYLATLDDAERTELTRLYATARALVPEAVEGPSYGMAALRYRDKPLFSAIAAKGHLSVFPFSPAVVEAVAGELEGYSLSKGTIRFGIDKPLPDGIVEKIVLLRRDEIDAAAKN